MNEKLKSLAKDLTKEYPRSPHETIGGLVVAARTLDKCRALLAETNGEYHYSCPLDAFFFNFAGIGPEEFKEFVATGADDDEVGKWIQDRLDHSDETIKLWNMHMRQKRIADLSPQLQLFLEGYIPQFIPKNRRVYTWFDVYDIEEGVI